MSSHGFTLTSEVTAKEFDGVCRLWRHDASGGRVLSFCNGDENKVFGVSFRTPPADSTGVAHILEHSVLCGSEKYPVKEPFVELLKGSLQTFLNAFTYPDKTCYPVASANRSDFYNLMDVYLDAVFFPRISKSIFQQEGWHLEKEGEGLLYKGVVYNEMKGAFSSPEAVLARYSLHALFPDTVYALESGGDPTVIPDLSYEDFIAFHRRYYHPANARFFFWGDDPEEERLLRLGAVLERFSTKGVPDAAASAITPQKPLREPRRCCVPFAASEGEKAMVLVNWLGPDVMDVQAGLAMRMLEHMLLGMPASPLRRALIESSLGEDLAGQGLETELRQLSFDAGLKGVRPENVDKVEALVLETLRDLAAQGFSDEVVEAAVNSVEFSLRENNTGRFPVGLSVMLRSLTTWLHDGDPLLPLRFEEPLRAIKEAVARKERFFEDLLSRWLVENRHRVTVVLSPDTGMAARQEEEEAKRLRAVADALDEEGRARLEAEYATLQEWQTSADAPEELARIPRLQLGDLPRDNAPIPTGDLGCVKETCFFHPLPTNGIVYAEAAFTLENVPDHLIPLLPLFGRALLEMGTRTRDFVDLNMTIARKTGGMDIDTLFLTHAGHRRPVARIVLSGKCAPDKTADLFSLMTELLTDSRLDQKERFSRMVLEEKARQEHALVPSGHMVVATRLRASFSGAGRLAECTGGVTHLHFVRKLVRRVEEDWPGVLADLEALRDCVLHQDGLAVNCTATAEQESGLRALCDGFLASLPASGKGGIAPWAGQACLLPEREALLLPAQVNYVGKGINLFDAGYRWHGSAAVILKYLRTGYLWEKVRVQGGAYGCMCGLDRMSGAFFMVSYRDPNILPTLNVYNEAAAHLTRSIVGRAEVDAAIVGAIGELDAYLLPDAKGSAAFTRHLCGDDDTLRARLREDILGTTAAHFKEFGEALQAFSDKGRICVLGGAALERVAAEGEWTVEKIL